MRPVRPARRAPAPATAPAVPAGPGHTAATSGRWHGDGAPSPGSGSSGLLQFSERFLDTDLSPPKAVDDVGAGGCRVGVDEVEVLGDPVEPGLDRRVAHPEDPLHLLDRTVRPHERGDEHLVVNAELGQLRRLELTL